jgi:predicted amidohydrolase
VVIPGGRLLGIYDKVMLPDDRDSQGYGRHQRPRLPGFGVRFAVNICADASIPHARRRLQGAELLHPHNQIADIPRTTTAKSQ